MVKLFLSFLISTFFVSPVWALEPVVIGTKNFTENFILGEVMALLLENKFNQPVRRKFGLGGTQIAVEALLKGNIHAYPDYTGTGYAMILNMSGERDPEKVYKVVSETFKKKWGVKWSKPIGFNNTYVLVVRNDDERFLNVKKVSDLSGKVGEYEYGVDHEFMEREDGHEHFSKEYSLNFQQKNIRSMDPGLMYAAIRDKEVDMIVAYSTDGRIGAYDLRIIEDDKKVFPPYYACLLAKHENLKKFPALGKVFDLMGGLINEDEMIYMNDEVDRKKRSPSSVAREFLVKKGLLEGGYQKNVEEPGFFNYLIQKKDYLIRILMEHLFISFGALFLGLLISLPLGIILTRHPILAKMVFFVVNTVQTIPSLALFGFLIPLMGIGTAPAILALFLYSLLPLIRNIYAGILGVDRSYLEVSRGMGLTHIQILFKVEIPFAIPFILAGLRTAAVLIIGTTTLAALIGAGGLGEPIFRGVATVNSNLILLGAIPAAVLAIIVDKIIGYSEKLLVSRGVALMKKK